MSRTSWHVSRYLQQVSRCLQQNPAGIIGCGEPGGMSLELSSRSPGISSRIQEESLDVANLVECLWTSPVSGFTNFSIPISGNPTRGARRMTIVAEKPSAPQRKAPHSHLRQSLIDV